MDSETLLFCNDATPQICYTATQELLNYFDTSLNNTGSLIDRIGATTAIFNAVLLFFIAIIAFKTLLKH